MNSVEVMAVKISEHAHASGRHFCDPYDIKRVKGEINPLFHTQTHAHTAAEPEEQESTHKLNGAYWSQPRTQTFVSLTGVRNAPDENVERHNQEGTHASDSGL